ncbi:ROK family protein [bacterium]|nr:ROK family protein [bacterium]
MAKSSNNRYWVGFDLGGTKMMATVFDHRFRPVASERRKTRGNKGARAGVARIVETIELALDAAGGKRRVVAGIGLGCPGWLDLDRGIILHAPNLGWRNLRLAPLLERRFRCPVILANDVDAGTYGEYRFGAARGARCVLGVFPGTGIGAGCVYEGRLIRGRTGSCFEFGHLTVEPEGRLCGCGHRGCLETVASRLAISAECAAAAYRGQAPHLLEQAGTDLANIRSGALAAAIRAGDTAIESILQHAADQLGIAVANVVNLLAPDLVVLGGGLAEALPRYFVRGVRAGIDRHAVDLFAKGVRVVAARLGDDATALGAAALAAEAAADRGHSRAHHGRSHAAKKR